MIRFWLFCLVLLSCLAACSTRAPDLSTFSGIATRVHDGDSIHVTPEGQGRIVIRLAGIDAPERQQRYGSDARDHLASMILNQPVEVHCYKKDRYKRQLCIVFHDNTDINLAMVSAGLAWHYKKFQNEQTSTQRRQYSAAEQKARTEQRGLWHDTTPIAPWDYRS